MTDGAPMIREDLKDKTRLAGKRKHYNHIFSWQAGDKAAATRLSPSHRSPIRETDLPIRASTLARSRPANASRRFDKIKGELTLYGTFQAPHVIRNRGFADQDPEHKIMSLPRYPAVASPTTRRLSGLYLLDRRPRS